MANDENLVPLNMRSERERKEIQSKGGKATAEARRQRKRMREALEELLEKTYTDKKTGRELDGVSMLMVSVIAKAQKGDIRAMEFIRSTIGEDPVKQVDVTASMATEAKFAELLEKYE